MRSLRNRPAVQPAAARVEPYAPVDPAQKGFSLLELVVVIVIIALLATWALDRLWGLQAAAERVAMEQVVGNLRSAIGIDVAYSYANGDTKALRALEGSNPMDRLAEVPKNYLGVLGTKSTAAGSWYFDNQSRTLVYRVRNAEYFRGGSGPPAQARFAVRLIYEASDIKPASGKKRSEIVGAELLAVAPYTWTDSGQEQTVP